jgi:hypothetical protein
MGMFDDLTVTGYPLPDGIERREYQTKSLECVLDHYEIRADGTLWVRNGWLKDGDGSWERTHVTDYIRFYDYDLDMDPVVVEFRAHVVDGVVQSIVRDYAAEQQDW